MTSRNNIKIYNFTGVNVAKHWHVAGEVFAISDCLVVVCIHVFSKTTKLAVVQSINLFWESTSTLCYMQFHSL